MHTTTAHSAISALIASPGAAAPGVAASLAAPPADGMSFEEHLGRSGAAGAGPLELLDVGTQTFATDPSAGPNPDQGADPVAGPNPDLVGLRDFLAQLLPYAAVTDPATGGPAATGADAATHSRAEPGDPSREARGDVRARGIAPADTTQRAELPRGAQSRRMHAENALARGAMRLAGEAEVHSAVAREGPERDAASLSQAAPGTNPGPAATSIPVPVPASIAQAAVVGEAPLDRSRSESDSTALASTPQTPQTPQTPAAQYPAWPAAAAAAAAPARGPAPAGRTGNEAPPWRAMTTALPAIATRPGAAPVEPVAQRGATEQGTRARAGQQLIPIRPEMEAMPQAAALAAPLAGNLERPETHSTATQRAPDGAAPIATLSTLGAAPALLSASFAPLHLELAVPVAAPQFREAFALQVSMLARDGVQHAVMQLNPAEMGPISIQISLDGQQAQIHFGSDSAQTRQLVEAGLPALAAALRESGLTLSGGGVSQHAPEPRQGSNDTAARPRHAATPEPELTPVLRSIRLVSGRLDTYA
jgi:flagellar hook-length control protein FliK